MISDDVYRYINNVPWGGVTSLRIENTVPMGRILQHRPIVALATRDQIM